MIRHRNAVSGAAAPVGPTSYKVLVVGASGVGKSTLVRRLCGCANELSGAAAFDKGEVVHIRSTRTCEVHVGQWIPSSSSSSSSAIHHARSTTDNAHALSSSLLSSGGIMVEYWDLSGSLRHEELARAYMKDVHGVIAVFDRSDPASLGELEEKWLPWVEKSSDGKWDIPVLLVASKRDVETSSSGASLSLSGAGGGAATFVQQKLLSVMVKICCTTTASVYGPVSWERIRTVEDSIRANSAAYLQEHPLHFICVSGWDEGFFHRSQEKDGLDRFFALVSRGRDLQAGGGFSRKAGSALSPPSGYWMNV